MSAFELYTTYDFLCFFCIYAFLGWCTEVAYAAVCHGKFVNRGFLNGPVCPIYGFGVVAVIAVLTPLKENGILLFVGSVIVTSVLEWVTGFVLEKVFHEKWWDYSDTPFNLSGYICLKFALIWGLACTFVMDIFHPTVVRLVAWIPEFAGWIIVSFLLIVIVADFGVTAASILKLNKRLEQMDEVAERLRETSERLGETISDNVVVLMEKSEAWKEKSEDVKDELLDRGEALQEEFLEKTEALQEGFGRLKSQAWDEWEQKQLELKAQMEDLRAKYNSLAEHNKFIHRRIIKAFPGMKSKHHAEAFEEIKKRYGVK